MPNPINKVDVHPVWNQLYKVGFSVQEIATAYGCSRTPVREFLISQGVKIRNLSQANYAGRLLDCRKYAKCGFTKESRLAIKTGKRIKETKMDRFYEGFLEVTHEKPKA